MANILLGNSLLIDVSGMSGAEIAEAINNGIALYELKYAVRVKNKMLRVKIDAE